MKNERKSGGTDRLRSLLKSGGSPGVIKDEAWNFDICPNREQTEACYLYEYGLESNQVKAEVAAIIAKDRLREVSKERDYEWLRANPAPKNYDQRQQWCERAKLAIPHAIVTTSLAYPLHFLTRCSHFPLKHWLEIPQKERCETARISPPHWGSTPAHMARRPLSIEPLPSYLETKKRMPNALLILKPDPAQSGDFVFSWHWPRSNRMLLKDFKKWLEETRPGGQPSLESTGQGESRKTSYKDLLKALAAFRLLRDFEGNFVEARFHSLNATGKPLYADQPAWLKAAGKAEKEIAAFEARMLRQK